MATKNGNRGETQNHKSTRKSTKDNRGRWPRGVHLRKRKDRHGWQVGWSITELGKRVRKFKLFENKELAEAFADEMATQVRDHGRQVLAFDPAEWQRWTDFKQQIEGASLIDVLAAWRAHLQVQRRAAITLGDAVRDYLQIVEREGMAGDYYSHAELHLQRLQDFCGEGTCLADVSVDSVREWLATLADEGDGGEGFSPVTIKNHLKHVRSFFTRAMAERWISESPADPSRVKAPKIVAGEKLALTLKDACLLFRANRDFRVCGRMALEAFAGVRYTGAGRLRREDVNWQDRFILLPAGQHKSGQRHVLDGLPENLWAWLKHADKIDKFWEMTERQYLEEKSAAFARAGVENPGNVLRRSFCSWRIALDGDARKVSAMMQHRNPEMLYRQYKTSQTRDGFVTRQDAPGWEKILP